MPETRPLDTPHVAGRGDGWRARLWEWVRARPLVWAKLSLAANILIVATGGAGRLTASGLGCPTWPLCTEDSL